MKTLIKLTASEKKRLAQDTATPEQRRWLDRMEAVDRRFARWIMDGPSRVTVLFAHRRLGGSAFGALATTFEQVKKDVVRYERQRKRAEAQEIKQRIGAFI